MGKAKEKAEEEVKDPKLTPLEEAEARFKYLTGLRTTLLDEGINRISNLDGMIRKAEENVKKERNE